ncbi:MAG TPA: galactose-1-phosphate uridylyltransferase [Roseiflexaceae bacterium]|nr:galactose-1-phosphate uridylyltransferase [Roseiflexaceae bacterium]HMP42171.1 galactose-1-phosphate uridylyltransferase [Roseiflexaceae bacterium]
MDYSPDQGAWEERWHPLREEWVIIAAHRQSRPWIGQMVGAATERPPQYVADCYLCPGNRRVGGAANPAYESVFVFDNDHPCVGEAAPAIEDTAAVLPPPYRVRRANGIARVICYSPRHDLTLAEMPPAAIATLVQTWQQQTHDLARRPEVHQVLIFENKGDVVGVSNPHPHGQIYATNFTWKTFDTELLAQQRYRREHGQALFAAIIAAEQHDGRRILFEDQHTIAFVPYFARYAYEVYVAPKRSVPHIDALTDAEVLSLAAALKHVTVRFDNLWRQSFPYVMPIHQAPTDGGDYRDFHCFIGFLPPLRRPNTLKYLAGPEIGGGNFLSDTSPEAKAAELRALPDVHWTEEVS